MSEMEKEYLKRIEYRFNKNDDKTKEIFNTLTTVLYNEFLVNPSFTDFRIKLENIINGNFESLSVDNQIKLNLLTSKYNLKYKFNNKKHGMYDVLNKGIYNNDIIESIRKIVMAPKDEKYHKIILYYMTYVYLKCTSKVLYEYPKSELEKDFIKEVECIYKFSNIFKTNENVKAYIDDNSSKFYNVLYFINNKLNGLEDDYYQLLCDRSLDIMDDDFTKYGNVKYKDNTNSIIKVTLPKSNVVINKSSEKPSILK